MTVLNTSNREIGLACWRLADKQINSMSLSGILPAGSTLLIKVEAPVAHSNKGWIFTLKEERGRKVHGICYPRQQMQQVDWTLAFQVTKQVCRPYSRS